ncbi:acyltransferase family protein [Corynebacterium heidelbergense]|uniref:Acyltransferase n=1 Tax=Corynebacterium heidelbergense TaxID=2055947 RepID=A0A364V3S2_9CORY|nr:acyltransferase family protein [Corynebacterium heidelbergense]RAV31279.1 hypothetical protein DLJ54_09210 [Corynebacterium heidelbergense]
MASSRFRHDVEGLRGLAIALVVVFHIFVGRVSSGVDVFLLLGGVFFFSSQLGNARNPKGLTFLQSLLRIIRRLFPLLAVVVGSTLAASLAFMSTLVHNSVADDSVAALGYYINWQLALSGREYTTAQNPVSPFQHLWSMSAQMQIYVASLLLVVVLAFIFRRHSRRALTVVLMALVGASFSYAAVMVGTNQSVNYYSTFSRFWEVGLGGLVGLLILPRRADNGKRLPPIIPDLPPRLRQVIGWAGLTFIIATGWVVNGAQTFPGPWTLLPLSGAVLVLLAGQGAHTVGVTRLLNSRPLQFLGGISYALYLWHWPLLILAGQWKLWQSRAVMGGLAVIVASGVLAWITNRLVERPLRQKSRPRRSTVLFDREYLRASFAKWPKVVYSAVIVVIAGAVVCAPLLVERKHQLDDDQLWTVAQDRTLYPGALAFTEGRVPRGNLPLVPPLEDFEALLPPTQPDGCQIGFEGSDVVLKQNYNKSDTPCAYGDRGSKKTLYVIGGSHSEHYMPAMDEVGKLNHIRVVPLLKMGCPVNSTVPLWTGEPYPSCREWSKKVVDYIDKNPPTEGIFMTSTRPTDIWGTGPETVPDEYVDLVKDFSNKGIHSWLVRDNPWHMFEESQHPWGPVDMRTCVGEMEEGHRTMTPRGREFRGVADKNSVTEEEIAKINEECGTKQDRSLKPVNPAIKAYSGLDVTHVDLTDAICKDGYCPAIIGNMVAYRDAHHFTNVFATTLVPELDRQMFPDR